MNSVAITTATFFTKHLRVLSVVIALSFVFACMPAPARAAGLTGDQVQSILALLKSFDADQATIDRVSRALAASSPVMGNIQKQDRGPILEREKEREHVQSTLPPLCVLLNRELKRGSSGEDVKKLQTILAQDRSIYAEAAVTGFFGPLTEAAVKRLQEKMGNLSITNATSTPGVVGPALRAALAARCNNKGEGAGQSEGQEKRVLQVTPQAGVAPLSVQFFVSAPFTTSKPALRLDFGDGTSVLIAHDARHTYTMPGVYIAKLMAAMSGICSSTSTTNCLSGTSVPKVVGTITIRVATSTAASNSSGGSEGGAGSGAGEGSGGSEGSNGVSMFYLTPNDLLMATATVASAPITFLIEGLSQAFFELGFY